MRKNAKAIAEMKRVLACLVSDNDEDQNDSTMMPEVKALVLKNNATEILKIKAIIAKLESGLID